MKKLLVIDDEPGIRTALKEILSDEGYQVFLAKDGFEGLKAIETQSINLVLLDVWLPNMGGVDVLKKIKELRPEIEIILISGHANVDLAVKAIKLGAYDFLEKPLSLDRVVTVVDNALRLENLREENRNLKDSIFIEDSFIGESDSIGIVRERIKQSAATDSKVLITGENGTGKELVAKTIHRQSSRRDDPFVEVNCAAIPDTLIESELFGHEKGAFTGAISRRMGKFEMANNGTLFLDEVADMSLSAQAKVLRVIQESRFERVGGETQISVDVRLITATNKHIPDEIKARRFREDLYFRLNVIPIIVPPLRERSEDIKILSGYFLAKFTPVKDGGTRRISPDGMKRLLNHKWPGNIRELKNFIERVSVMSDEEEISAETVGHFLGDTYISLQDESLSSGSPYAEMSLGDAKAEFERALIIRKLEQNGYNISQTAEKLGIYPSNLHAKLKKYRISTK